MFSSWRMCCQIRSKQRNKKRPPGMQPHSNNTSTDCPSQCHNSCVPFAEHTADGKTETGVAWTENHPLCLVCGCVLISSKRVFWMLPSLLSSPRTFQWSCTCSEAGCLSSGCSQLYLPSSCWLIALELVSDTCQGKVPLHSTGSEYLISPVSKSS